MHFRLPKPLHGWREFVGEVGIIVFGVLIALAAESLVDDWRWHRQIQQADGAFKQELLLASSYGYERLAIQSCLQGRLRDLATQLNDGGEAWHATPEHFSGASRYYVAVLPVVYRPPTRPLTDDAWRNALADGTINHLRQSDAQALSSAYASADSYREVQGEENRAETKLTPLGTDRVLDTRTRIEMLQSIGELDRLNDLLVTYARNLFEAVKGAKLGISRAETEQIRKQVLRQQRSYRGSCVAAPPLDLSKE